MSVGNITHAVMLKTKFWPLPARYCFMYIHFVCVVLVVVIVGYMHLNLQVNKYSFSYNSLINYSPLAMKPIST